MRNFLFVMSAVVVLGGCATPGKNTAIGAGAGAAMGAGVGAIAGGWEGAAIGAVVGGVAGGAIGNYLDKQEQAEISRIERDIVDPRLGTYVKLLEGVGLGLRVERVHKGAISKPRQVSARRVGR